MKRIEDQVTLPCGHEIKNRLAKSAMSENMADKNHWPNEKYNQLYRRWAEGGIGLCITGNVMIDPTALGEPNNVVLESNSNLEPFVAWTSSVKGHNMSLWVQLNHPGKQSPNFLSPEPVAPSAIPLDPFFRKFFNTPRALLENEIWLLIERFASSALLAKNVGFDGVQIHGAHGYLISQFLSPKHNQRTDQWGGSIENRMRFLKEIYLGMRRKVGPSFPIGVKINSSDFQKGGFSADEALIVARMLSDLGIDLIEISGGSYEKPIMMGDEKESTKKREAYFLQLATDIKKVIQCPMLVTGGFRTPEAMKNAIENDETDFIGLARSLALDPDFPRKILSGQEVISLVRPLTSGFKLLDKMFAIDISWYTMQLHRMGNHLDPEPKASVWRSIFSTIKGMGLSGLKRVRA